MARQGYHQQMADVREQVVLLGEAAAQVLDQALTSLVQGDCDLARAAIGEAVALDGRRARIEVQAFTLMATQQPVATDLRAIVATMHIAGELERIGDYAKGIARTTLEQEGGPPLLDWPALATCAQTMFGHTLDALRQLDPEAARAAAHEDDAVDDAYARVYGESLARMQHDPHLIGPTIQLLRAGHNLERAADRATNICELVVYEVTGETVALNRQPD